MNATLTGKKGMTVYLQRRRIEGYTSIYMYVKKGMTIYQSSVIIKGVIITAIALMQATSPLVQR